MPESVTLLWAAAFIILAVRLNQYRQRGLPLRLIPQSLAGRFTAGTVLLGVIIWGAADGAFGGAIIPAITLAGLAGLAADGLHGRRNTAD